MAQVTARHVQQAKLYEHAARVETLPENITEASTATDDALATVLDPVFGPKQKLGAGKHLRDMVNAGTAGLIPMSAETMRSIDPATQTLINSDSAHERATGIRLATATAAHNLSAAEAIDKATRLDAGTATDVVTLGPMRMPGARVAGGTPPETEGGGDPDTGTLPAHTPVSEAFPIPDPVSPVDG